MQMFDEESVKLVRGRTASSLNLLHRGFRYSKDGKLTLDGRQAWRCVKKNDKCRGRLYTLDGSLKSVTQPHNHDADIADCEVRQVLSQVHDLAATTVTPNHRIYCSVTGPLSQDARVRLPSEEAVKKQAQRARRKENPKPRAPTTLAELDLEEDDCMSLAGETMLLFDNKEDERRIIIFGTAKNLRILGNSLSWYVDATFSSSPQLFYQLLTIHAEITNFNEEATWVFPCVYILLTHKDTPIYKEAFDALDSLADFCPDHIMVDYELALRNALSETFLSAQVDGCYFHFCQAVMRAVQRLGYKEEYEKVSTDPTTGQNTYSPTRIWIRSLHPYC